MLPHAEAGSKGLPALAYAVAYPGGVLGIIFCIVLLRLLFRINPGEELAAFEKERRGQAPLLKRRTIRVTNPALDGLTIAAIPGLPGAGVVASRIRDASTGTIDVATGPTRLHAGDTLLAVGTPADLDRFQAGVGEPSGRICSAPIPASSTARSSSRGSRRSERRSANSPSTRSAA